MTKEQGKFYQGDPLKVIVMEKFEGVGPGEGDTLGFSSETVVGTRQGHDG